jgi:hypothetical protein
MFAGVVTEKLPFGIDTRICIGTVARTRETTPDN